MLTPSRLVLARKRRGLTAAEVARAVGVSASSIGDYEHGRRRPAAGKTAALAEALGFPVEFLEAPDEAELPCEAVAFRAAARVPVPRRDAAVAAGRLAIGFNRWLERTFTLPVPDVPTVEHPDPETAATMVRGRWGLGSGPAPTMVHLLEAHGVRVFSLPVDCADVDAFSFWHAGTPFVFLNPTTSAERGRFDAAHELGHLVLHANIRPEDAERQANTFAGAFLMPRAGVLASVPRGPVTEQVLTHRTHWRVSALALTYRLRDLGLLTADQYGVVCADLSRRGYRLAEPDGLTAREGSLLLSKVFRTLRDRGTSPQQVARELLLDPAELNTLLFGLVVTALPGESQATTRRGRLTLVL
ncbi:helix-turn-helix domain-containing protein [Umezawaea endophytica]|uniref:XRE family transcriptional regulator n=1 Tax=Umezawaea endophytica TaxID=1654476 RepID=A0A9X3A4C9_9PSEU|nr:XRE family transcriptional regulator [Umezawaea endophytica]MCS7482714.1 XRE family transcriptional regulator [Umezawaea endophytica]